MADQVGIAVVGEIVKKLIDQISHQFSYLFSYTSNIKSLEDGDKDLKDTKDGVKKMVEAGERNLEEVGKAGKTWLDKVEENEKMAQEILEGTKMVKEGCMKGWCPNLKQRYSLSRKAVKQILVVKKLKEEGKTFTEGQLFDPKLPAGVVASSSTTGLEVFKSRISATNEVIAALKNDSISKVGICGLGGIGKTRMAREIRERALIEKNFFDAVAMADVSQNPNLKKIQDQLAVMLGLKLEDDESVGDRGKRLRKRLTQGDSRILVILDDLWDELDLGELGIPVRSQGEANGCKLLITSRDDRVCNIMEAQIFRVQLLSEEEAWALFKQNAGDCVETSEFRSVAEKVLKECGHLPLAIITVGAALKDCRKYEWEDALRQLERSRVTTIEGMDTKVYASLRLSYDYLARWESSTKDKEGNEHQQLFLLCCIFPEDDNIPVELLVRFSVGLGFLNDVEDLESARNRVRSLVDQLKSCHLLEHSDEEGCVKMHDLVRHFGLKEASNGEHVHMVKHDVELKQWPQSDAINPTAISIISGENLELPRGLDYPLLRLLLFITDGSIQVSKDYFRGMKELRVLLISTKWVSFDSGTMAKAPELLMKVRTLCLERCRFSKDIGLIGSLCNLEILSFRSTEEIDVLPKEIGQLKKLKLLDLRGCEVGLVESGVLSSLTKLEELYMGGYFNKKGVEELNNGNCARVTEFYSLSCLRRLQLCVSEPGLIMMLKDFPGEKLTRFHFSMSSYSEKWDYDFANEVDLNSVDLGKLSGSKFEALMRRAEVVSLSSVSGWKNITRESDIKVLLPSMETLRLRSIGGEVKVLNHEQMYSCFNLQRLQVSSCNEMEVLFDLKGVEEIPHGQVGAKIMVLGQLDTIRILSLYELRDIWKNVPKQRFQGFNNLTNIDVSYCHKLRYLMSISMGKLLVNLQVINVTSCKLMEYVITIEEEKESSQPQFEIERTDKIVFPNLLEVNLKYLNLKAFCQGSCDVEFPSLKKVYIYGCNMKKILRSESPTPNFEVLLPSMETLRLRSIGGAVKVLNHEQMYSCFNLQKLQVSSCNEMEVLFDSEGVEEIPDGQVGEKVMVLAQLDTIRIRYLKELREIWKNVPKQGFQGFHNLTVLDVSLCEKLRYLLSPCMAELLVNLQVIKVENCGEMEYVIMMEEESSSHSEKEKKMDKIVFPRLQELELTYLKNLKAFCQGSYGLQFPSLKKVEICACSNMKRIFCSESSAHNFKAVISPSLETLTLDYMATVKLVGGEFQSESFHNLRALNVYKCHKLRYLVSPYMAKLLVNLQVLEVVGCEKMEYVIMIEEEESSSHTETEKRMDKIVFPRLQELLLHHLENLIAVCQGSYDLQFPSLKNLDIWSCNNMKRIFSSESPAHNFKEGVLLPSLETLTLNKLRVLKVDECDSMETLFDFEGVEVISGEEVMVLGQLDAIYIKCLKELRDIWKNVPKQGFQGFHNLTVLDVYKCNKLRYLMSPCMAKLLVNLQVLEVVGCEKMEYVIMIEEESSSHSEKEKKMDEIVFPRLQVLKLRYLKNLKAFCQGSYDLQFPSLKKVEIYSCFNLQRLEVSSCNEMEVLFDLEGVEEIPHGQVGEKVMVLAQLDTIKIRYLEELREIWKNVPKQGFQGFHNLTLLDVYKCPKLRYLMSPCMAKLLVNLQVIKVENCGEMEYVIMMEEESSSHSEKEKKMDKIVFPRLQELELRYLKNLKVFCQGSYGLQFPSLKKVEICACSNMRIFCSESHAHNFKEGVLLPSLETLYLNDLRALDVRNCDSMETLFDFEGVDVISGEEVMVLGQLDAIEISYLFELREIWKNVPKQGFQGFHNLTVLNVYKCPKLRYLMSPCMAKLLVNLQVIKVENCGEMEYVIMIEEESSSHSEKQKKMDKIVFPKLQELKLQYLENLTAVCQGSYDLQFPSLKKVLISDCSNMKRIFSSESPVHNFKDAWEREMMSEIDEMDEMDEMDLMTQADILKSALNAPPRGTRIPGTGSVRVAPKKRGPNREGASTSRASTPPSIEEVRQLRENIAAKDARGTRCMAKLLVNLQVIKITRCEKMEYVIMIEEESSSHSGKEKKMDKIVFPRLQELELTYLKNLKAFCQGSYGLQFPSLKKVEICACSNMMRIFCSESSAHNFKEGVLLPSLETLYLNDLRALDVRNCDSMETLFDFEGVDVISGEEVMVLGQLDAIEISYLFELREIWKNVPKQGFQGFHNLTVLNVYKCPKLRYLMSPCMAKLLVNLQVIKVENCGEMEYVIMIEEESSSHSEKQKKMDKIVFPKLQELKLQYLENLTAVCQGSYDLQFPSLKKVLISDCSNMKRIFSSESPVHNFKDAWEREMMSEIDEMDEMDEMDLMTQADILKSALNAPPRGTRIPGTGSVRVAPKKRGPNREGASTSRASTPPSIEEVRQLRENIAAKDARGTRCMAKLLVNLQVIKITRCEKMEYVIMIEEESSSHSGKEKKMDKIVFPRLQELELTYLKNLKAFCQGSYGLQFPSLKKVEICACSNMMRIFCSESSAHNFKEGVLLPSLETLYLNDLRALDVRNCDSMETLFDFEGVDVISGEEVMVLGQLDTIEIRSLLELREIWKNVPKQGFQGFHNLTVLDVFNCPNLKYLMSPCMAKLLVNLQVIEIRNCKEMEEVIQRDDEEEEKNTIVFPHLREIHLNDLWKLKAFHEGNCSFVFPSLDQVFIKACFKMNKFCSSSVSQPKLQHVQIGYSSVPLMVDLNTTIQNIYIERLKRIAESSISN